MESKGLILVLEDNKHIMSATKGMLEMAGYTPHPAMSIREARAALAEVNPDAILLDMELPDGNGLDFCREICGMVKAPICILTAGGLKTVDVRYLASGADHLIQKPYNFDDLFAWLEEVLGAGEPAGGHP